MLPRTLTIEQKLAHYSDRSGGPDSCWEWKGGLAGRPNEVGYGAVWWKGKQHRAHRLMWEITNGPIPPGLHCCHKCDNTKCINPAHIFLGTDADNHRDRDAKGRGVAGRPNVKGCRLTDAEVMAIRADTRTREAIAADYGISAAHVTNIKLGKRRRYVPSLLTAEPHLSLASG